MLVPIRTQGEGAPLIFLHGYFGVFFGGEELIPSARSDRPLYAINAPGFDGSRPPLRTVTELADEYIAETLSVVPDGKFILGGYCQGAFIAMEMARLLLSRGRAVMPPILIDPGHEPCVPFARRQARTGRMDDARVMTQRYDQAQGMVRDAARMMPIRLFDPSDPNQTGGAARCAMTYSLMFDEHVPLPFAGPTMLILSSERAHGFFSLSHAWQAVLPGPRRIVHVFSGSHMKIMLQCKEQRGRYIEAHCGAIAGPREAVSPGAA
jgi:thioesterase domain-containing protein